MKTKQRRRGFFGRLAACTVGGISDLSTPLIVAGLLATGAALVGATTNTSVGNATDTVGARTRQGTAGHMAGKP